ncbi:hypothetical protein [Rivibacter subsaxonicus]|uniref:hypothetical protein n=1 Tax=Rivibacter subsaxonicus TaxID=457575 RepID=UPI00102B6B4C|nr:hypothetical protein [Rivibacter subsaxonicus]
MLFQATDEIGVFRLLGGELDDIPAESCLWAVIGGKEQIVAIRFGPTGVLQMRLNPEIPSAEQNSYLLRLFGYEVVPHPGRVGHFLVIT